MPTPILFDLTACLHMAFVALVVGLLLPLPRKEGANLVYQTKQGLVRAGVGIFMAVGSWTGIEAMGSTFSDRMPQAIEVPLVFMPKPAPPVTAPPRKYRDI